MFFRCCLFKANFLIKIALLSFLLCFKAIALDTKIPVSEEEWNKAYTSLNWKEGPSLVNFNKRIQKLIYPQIFQY